MSARYLRQQNDFHIYYEPPFYFHREGLCVSASYYRFFGALFALYIIWGSTYFVIRIGVESWPPLMMAGVRFLAAGILLLAFLLLRGTA